MDKTEVRRIIEATLSGGNKFLRLFDLPKNMGIKTKHGVRQYLHR